MTSEQDPSKLVDNDQSITHSADKIEDTMRSLEIMDQAHSDNTNSNTQEFIHGTDNSANSSRPSTSGSNSQFHNGGYRQYNNGKPYYNRFNGNVNNNGSFKYSQSQMQYQQQHHQSHKPFQSLPQNTADAGTLTLALEKALHTDSDRPYLLSLEQQILQFLADSSKPDRLELLPVNSYFRLLTHHVAGYYDLGHVVRDGRFVILFRSKQRHSEEREEPEQERILPKSLFSYEIDVVAPFSAGEPGNSGVKEQVEQEQEEQQERDQSPSDLKHAETRSDSQTSINSASFSVSNDDQTSKPQIKPGNVKLMKRNDSSGKTKKSKDSQTTDKKEDQGEELAEDADSNDDSLESKHSAYLKARERIFQTTADEEEEEEDEDEDEDEEEQPHHNQKPNKYNNNNNNHRQRQYQYQYQQNKMPPYGQRFMPSMIPPSVAGPYALSPESHHPVLSPQHSPYQQPQHLMAPMYQPPFAVPMMPIPMSMGGPVQVPMAMPGYPAHLSPPPTYIQPSPQQQQQQQPPQQQGPPFLMPGGVPASALMPGAMFAQGYPPQAYGQQGYQGYHNSGGRNYRGYGNNGKYSNKRNNYYHHNGNGNYNQGYNGGNRYNNTRRRGDGQGSGSTDVTSSSYNKEANADDSQTVQSHEADQETKIASKDGDSNTNEKTSVIVSWILSTDD